MIAQIEKVVVSLDPEIVITTSTLEDELRLSPPFVGSTLAAATASSIGSFGLLIALIGIFGTVSHIVALRTREVGIRIAIGAQERDVLGLILFESSRPVLIGSAIGMTLALGAAYLMRNLFYGINAIDGIYFVAVAALFFLVTMLASYPPARRALRIDPVAALRHD
jgi:ABC-type antimicrobial peptide transport system permease subunit